MADRDYNFTVFSSTLSPFDAAKENLDITRFVYDFTNWLDPGEVITQIDFPTISMVATGAKTIYGGNWQADYPFPDTSSPPTPPTDPAAPADTYPAVVVSEDIAGDASNVVEIKVIAGTPGFTYVLSFLVTASISHRRKQVDTTIYVEPMANMAMAGPGEINPEVTPPLVLTDSGALPMGFAGMVLLTNSAGLNGIVVTLPPNPVTGQMVEFIDVLGTDTAHPVTIRADSDNPVDADGSLYFVSTINYDCLRWEWTGVNWHLQTRRYAFLG